MNFFRVVWRFIVEFAFWSLLVHVLTTTGYLTYETALLIALGYVTMSYAISQSNVSELRDQVTTACNQGLAIRMEGVVLEQHLVNTIQKLHTKLQTCVADYAKTDASIKLTKDTQALLEMLNTHAADLASLQAEYNKIAGADVPVPTSPLASARSIPSTRIPTEITDVV